MNPDKMTKRLVFGISLTIALGLLFLPVQTNALLLDYFLGHSITEGVSAHPVSVSFDDQGSAGSVKLAITLSDLGGEAFLTELLFNIDPDLESHPEFENLVFVYNTIESTGQAPSEINISADSYKGEGIDYYDFQLKWSVKQDFRFEEGKTVVLDIYDYSGLLNLTADDFTFLNEPKKGGVGDYEVIAKVQAINEEDDSGWMAVSAIPEPTAILLLGFSLIGLAVLKRKFKE